MIDRDISHGKWYGLTPLDSWFFRESRPHGAAGGSELQSVFPPPARTIAGAIRTLIGNTVEVNWSEYARGDGRRHKLGDELDLIEEMGDADGFGKLRLCGPHINLGTERLYKVPLHILQYDDMSLTMLSIPDNGIECDLGRVRLPILKGRGGAKVHENHWVTENGMLAILRGDVPALSQIISINELVKNESRLGIACEHSSRTAADGMLYQTRHLRLHDDISIAFHLSGIADKLQPSEPAVITFGGEGRQAAIALLGTQSPASDFKLSDSVDWRHKHIILVLLTVAMFGDGGTRSWLPDGFIEETCNGISSWVGVLNGIRLRIVSAVTGRVQREGGWNVAKHEARPVCSLIPAGSVYFCELLDDATADQAAKQLNRLHIGKETEIGRGEIAVGIWK